MTIKLIPVILFLFCSLWQSDCFAQTELSLHTAYEVPLDEFQWIYNPAPNYQLSISKTDKYKNKRSSWGVTLGYANFIPKEEEFYYLVNSDEIGTIRYTDYQVVQLALNLRKDFIMNRIELFFGADIGYQYVIFGYESADAYQLEDATNIVSRIMLAPKAGGAFLITDHLSVFAQLRFNCSIGPAIEKQTGLLNYYIGPGLGLNFRF